MPDCRHFCSMPLCLTTLDPIPETAMRQFVPMTDDMLERVDELPGPLVPYQCGLPCWHRLRDESERLPAPSPLPSPAATVTGSDAGLLLSA
jgi:hypothetical protein